jgi:peptidoglycan/LPS O-acetylase OafA/YrhL
MRSSNNVYLERVDILRFIAATFVIFWHYIHFANVVPFTYVPRLFPFSILTEGHTGVALFMVLSGFIFQYNNSGKELVFVKFLRNRFFRIFPLAIFWILILVAIDHLNSSEVLLNTFFVFDSRSVPGVGWTIVVEFQFYLLFPVLHKVIEKDGGIFNILGLILLMILIRAALFVNTTGFRDFAYYTIFGRLDQFLMGMIAAKLYTSGRSATFFQTPGYEKIRILLLLLITTTLLIFFNAYNKAGGYMGSESTHLKSAFWIIFNDIEAVFYSFIIVFYLSIHKYNLIKPVEGVLARFGEFSYSMYWIHAPVIKALFVTLHRFSFFNLDSFRPMFLSCLLIIVPAVIFASALSYYFFEKPFLQFRQNYSS